MQGKNGMSLLGADLPPAVIGLIVMTFVTMLGGNPLRDRFGFRFW